MFGWFSSKKKSRYAAGADRAERNAVIKRIVSAAADEVRARNAAAHTPNPAAPPVARTADGQPITPLPAGKPAAAPDPAPLTDTDPPPDEVARRAHDIWVRRGRPTGTADQDWQQAVAELRAERLFRPADAAQ